MIDPFIILKFDMIDVLTINDKSYAREKLCSFRGFSMHRESFPLSNGGTFNTEEAKP